MKTMRTKMGRAGKTAWLILLATLALIKIVLAYTNITVTGSWSLSIGQANLTGGAGTNLASTYLSATNQATLSVTNNFFTNWRIDVKRVDTTWNANLHLWVKRTNNGTSGSGSYSGGTTFIDLTTTNQTFMTGYYNRSGFTLQFQLTGVSTAIAAASYSTTITYTIVETW